MTAATLSATRSQGGVKTGATAGALAPAAGLPKKRVAVSLLPDGGSHKIPRGFHEWLCDDDAGQTYTPPDFASPQSTIAEWCKTKATLPVRITLRIHNAGDGIAHETRKRITFQKVPMHVWFFDKPDAAYAGPRHLQPDAMKNLERMMPRALWARLYGCAETTAQGICQRHGFKQLDNVCHKGLK